MGSGSPGCQGTASRLRGTFSSLLCMCASIWEPLRGTRNEYKRTHTHTPGCGGSPRKSEGETSQHSHRRMGKSFSGECAVRFGISAVRKESGDRPEKDRMREQQRAVRWLGLDRFRLKMTDAGREEDER